MTPLVMAQALVEKGALDGAIAAVSGFFSGATDLIVARPYLLIVVAVALFFLLKPRR